jgi:Fic family protein
LRRFLVKSSLQADMRKTGTIVQSIAGGENVEAFVPHGLPPSRPGFEITAARAELLAQAGQALAKLGVATELVPSLEWFLYGFVRKEAVLSAQIEGTQASLIDLLEYEAELPERGNSAESDVEEVSNYLAALAYARKQMTASNGLPLSLRLLNETHRRLLKGSRGASKQAGSIRRAQNWIGGSRASEASFVPPPPNEVPRLLSELEKFIHAEGGLAPLIKMGLIHAQFETIHPYLDGNGRMGRLLIALLLEEWKLLPAPLLYLSVQFKRRRAEYYRRLNDVRLKGDWEGWIDFFLEAIRSTADEGLLAAQQLFALVNKDRARVLAASGSTVMTLRLLDLLPRHPVVTIAQLTELLGTTKPTVAKAIVVLEKLKIISETTGRERGRAFRYEGYLNVLRADTDLVTP